jgi:hypothetical protein
MLVYEVISMDIDKEMIKGYIESIILSLLRNEDLYGYEISKRISDLSKNTFQIKEGTLYVVLKRLENNKLITPYWDDTESVEEDGGITELLMREEVILLRKLTNGSFLKIFLMFFIKEGIFDEQNRKIY